jgi:hypothetical protein
MYCTDPLISCLTKGVLVVLVYFNRTAQECTVLTCALVLFMYCPGVYSADLRKHYDLKDPQWRYDIMPEVVNGHNIADFIDPDIDAKLAELEREEEEMERQHAEEVRG